MFEALNIRERTSGELIAEAMRDTVAELRLIDAADLVGYIKAGQWANIADLLQSSAELSFVDNALSFACSADVELTWGQPPVLTFELEFQYGGVNAFFTLLLAAEDSKVAVSAVLFASQPRDDVEALRTLAAALTAARSGRMSDA